MEQLMMENFKITNTERDSICIHTPCGLNVWMDFDAPGGEFSVDWNKYIFHLEDPTDLKIKDFQESPENFDICSSIVYEYWCNLAK